MLDAMYEFSLTDIGDRFVVSGVKKLYEYDYNGNIVE